MTATSMSRPARIAAPLMAALVLVSACGDDAPTYPTAFDPATMQAELGAASAALSSPATESFSATGYMIDWALSGMGGGGLVLEAPALLLEGPIKANTTMTARLRAQAQLNLASALPAAALGKTFEFDAETDEYVMGARTGAPANGVRFVLCTIDPILGLPAMPLVEAGHVDLTRTGTQTTAVARVEVHSSLGAPTKVLDYSATVSGAATSPSIVVQGFARNALDELDFTLTTSFSMATEAVTVDWRTEAASHGLVTRLKQSFLGGDNPRFTIDAAVISPSGRIDVDGTVSELVGGSLSVKVNGKTFATMHMTSGDDGLPTIVNAGGDPLSAEEQATLEQIFEWFAGAFVTYITLLAPLGTLLDLAF